MLTVKSLVEVFYQLEEVPFHSEFADTFYHEWMSSEFCQVAFPHQLK